MGCKLWNVKLREGPKKGSCGQQSGVKGSWGSVINMHRYMYVYGLELYERGREISVLLNIHLLKLCLSLSLLLFSQWDFYFYFFRQTHLTFSSGFPGKIVERLLWEVPVYFSLSLNHFHSLLFLGLWNFLLLFFFFQIFFYC